jgi:hypothetical protein
VTMHLSQVKPVIRFTVKRRYEFKCPIHPDMRDELLLLHIEAV